MALYVRAAMLCILYQLFTTPTVAGVRFAMIPDYLNLSPSHDNDEYIATATDVQTCLDAAYNATSTIKAISFDDGECLYYTDIGGYQLGAGAKTWVRIDQHMKLPAVTSCLTEQDARYLLKQVIYGDDMCPLDSLFDSTSGFCTRSGESGIDYASVAGSLQNGTSYWLSRTQTADSVNYLCDDGHVGQMIFNGTWYCYYWHTLNSSEQAKGESLISGDYCSQIFGSTAHVVKISEEREYKYLHAFFGQVLLGVTLRSGTTYQWYDGTTAANLPWLSGTPLGGSKILVRIYEYGEFDGDHSKDGYTVEAIEPPFGYLICKKQATHIAYDACAKFKMCT